ncbi:MAG TPA: hypothetical protein VM367_08570 [Pseudonocardia sp.]|nr:hypothetical protein [Pseudonocardia sp.]
MRLGSRILVLLTVFAVPLALALASQGLAARPPRPPVTDVVVPLPGAAEAPAPRPAPGAPDPAPTPPPDPDRPRVVAPAPPGLEDDADDADDGIDLDDPGDG